jgi:hypothetical protein
MAESKRMGELELKAILEAEINDAMKFSGDLSKQRTDAMKYYLGEPFGDEAEGRSKVVSTDVSDCIEWMLPSLINTFISSDQAVRFEPIGEEDEKAAEQETDYVNHVFYSKNNGFLVFYTWFKDALLQKNGYVKAWWEKSEKVTRETYENLSDDELAILMQDESLEPIESETTENRVEMLDPMSGQVVQVPIASHNVKFKRTEKKGKPCIELIPPEDIGVSRRHRQIELTDCPFVTHKWRRTVSELIEMGYDPNQVDTIPSANNHDTEEEIARDYLSDEQNTGQNTIDKSMREIQGYECYIRVDFDGDGIAELRKVNYAGREILKFKDGKSDNEEVDRVPIHSMTPIILTHKHYGLSIADLVMDLQKIKSTIWRQILDNMYFVNNSRNVIDQNRVNLDDMLTSRPNGIVRVNGDPASAVVPMVVPPIASQAYPMIEYIDKVREGRSGVSQMSMGINPDILNNNKGDESMARMMTTALQRIELIARVFAETGVKSLFLHLHELLQKHQDKETVVKLRNEWVSVRPQEWRERTDMTIHVGLGTGQREKLAMAINMLMQIQQQMVQAGALDITVTSKNIYNAACDVAKYFGIKNVDQYFRDPTSQEAQQAMQAKNQAAAEAKATDPAAQLVRIEGEKNQLKVQEMGFKHQQEMAKLQSSYEQKLMEMQQKQDNDVNNLAAKLTELELKYSQNVPGALV